MIAKLLIIGAGGFVGAVARYLASGAVHSWSRSGLPWGTFAVNVVGCLIIGALMGLVEDRPTLGPNARLFLVIGLLGSFTTFSTFGYETLELMRDGQFRWALLNVAASVLLGVGAVILGRMVVRLAGM